MPSDEVVQEIPSVDCAHITLCPGSSSSETDNFHVAKKRLLRYDSIGDIAYAPVPGFNVPKKSRVHSVLLDSSDAPPYGDINGLRKGCCQDGKEEEEEEEEEAR